MTKYRAVYKSFIKPILFRFTPEKAHHLTFQLLKSVLVVPGMRAIFKGLYNYKNPSLEREVFGIRFKNPVGLAAGFDKDAKIIDELSVFGFGFIEIGTLTPKGQPGNPQPRLFRLPQDEALINRMGFNNEGVDVAVERLKKANPDIIIGGNIGKNKVTPNEEAFRDYQYCFEALFAHVDYFVVNVSSPNTPNLRELQEKEPLKQLLSVLQERNKAKTKVKPILLKIAPDLTTEQLDDIIEIVEETGIAGVIATNTTISRNDLKTSSEEISAIGAGGLSGRPVTDKSTEVIAYLHEKSAGRLTIIAVGGIFNGNDALEKLNAGASLVQVYTGFIYEGPAMVSDINRYLASTLK